MDSAFATSTAPGGQPPRPRPMLTGQRRGLIIRQTEGSNPSAHHPPDVVPAAGRLPVLPRRVDRAWDRGGPERGGAARQLGKLPQGAGDPGATTVTPLVNTSGLGPVLLVIVLFGASMF